MDEYSNVFRINKGAKTEKQPVKKIPDFSDKNKELGAHDFKVYSTDISDLDLRTAGDKINYIRFDTNTIFPSADKMPDDFDPTKIIEENKNPGLGIRDLHKRGITGKGITVAIIDQSLNTRHVEIKNSIIHYESIGYPENASADFHGTAVSSLLAGETLGVAPDAKIVYFAANNLGPGYDGEKPFNNGTYDLYFANYADALRKILLMNTKLPKDKQISAVSISWGMLHVNEECTKMINQLIENGVMVLTTDSYMFYGDKGRFMTIDKKINSDADNIESYNSGFWRNNFEKVKNRLLVPAGGRTIAGYQDDAQYIYCGANGGMSWATPYMVGVYALAKQVMPNLTPQHFFDVARQVGTSSDKLGDNIIIQPKNIVKCLQDELYLQKQSVNNR